MSVVLNALNCKCPNCKKGNIFNSRGSLLLFKIPEMSDACAADINIEKLGSPNYSILLENLENAINTHFYTEKLPKFYANQLHITTKHLNRVVRHTINKTTSQLISERILLESKRLIVHSNNNLANVANTLGFSDYAYFSKFFKAKTGVTPIHFKKKYFH